MHIDYDTDTQEIRVEANSNELLTIANSLLVTNSQINCHESEHFTRQPYTYFLQGIKVVHIQKQFIQISISENIYLKISGDLKYLIILADNIKTLSKNQKWQHVHFEYFPDHPFLAENSLAVIFQIFKS